MGIRRTRVLAFAGVVVMAAAVAVACASFGSPPPPADGDGSVLDGAGNDDAPDCDGGRLLALNRFDDNDAIAPPSWAPVVLAGSSLAVTGSLPGNLEPTSPPAALLASGPIPDVDGGFALAYVAHEIGSIPSSLSVRQAVSMPHASSYMVVGCQLELNGAAADGGAALAKIYVFALGGLFVNVQIGHTNALGGGPVAIGAAPRDGWFDLALDIVFDGSSVSGQASARAHASGAPIGIGRIPEVVLPFVGRPTGKVECGLGYADQDGVRGTPGFAAVSVDDVVVCGSP